MDDLNIDVKNKTNPNFDKFSEFCDTFSMSNLIKDYTCFTKTHKSSIDLILTNKEHSFQLTKTTETGVRGCLYGEETSRQSEGLGLARSHLIKEFY